MKQIEVNGVMRDVVDFPKRAWWYSGWSWKIFWRGGDEFGQHTLAISLPGVGSLVVVYKRYCDCEDMAEFKCKFPCCPFYGVTTDSYCMTHNEEFYTGYANGEYDD